MITDIILTAAEVCAFFGGIYFIIIYLWSDAEKKRQDKICPHCRVPSPKVSLLNSIPRVNSLNSILSKSM